MEKCLVVSFEKEAKSYIQENPMITRSVNHRRKKIVDGIDTKPQISLVLWNTDIFWGTKKFVVLLTSRLRSFNQLSKRMETIEKSTVQVII